MKSRHLIFFSICALGLLYPMHYFSGQTQPALDSSVPNQYCTGCHNQKAKVAGLMLDSIDYADLAKNAETWVEPVVRHNLIWVPNQLILRGDDWRLVSPC